MFYLKPKSKGVEKLYESRWECGIWRGIREESGETFIGIESGVIKVRSVLRKASDADRWDIVAFENMKGTPWEPEPGRPGIAVRCRVRLPDESSTSVAEHAPRTMKLQDEAYTSRKRTLLNLA